MPTRENPSGSVTLCSLRDREEIYSPLVHAVAFLMDFFFKFLIYWILILKSGFSRILEVCSMCRKTAIKLFVSIVSVKVSQLFRCIRVPRSRHDALSVCILKNRKFVSRTCLFPSVLKQQYPLTTSTDSYILSDSLFDVWWFHIWWFEVLVKHMLQGC